MVSAIQYIHSYDLVHRDIKLDNILVFKSDFSRIKLCDFGETRKNGSWVTRRNEWIPYMPPEILAINAEHKYKYGGFDRINIHTIIMFCVYLE